jgi:excisionase family DNA binding protein
MSTCPIPAAEAARLLRTLADDARACAGFVPSELDIATEFDAQAVTAEAEAEAAVAAVPTAESESTVPTSTPSEPNPPRASPRRARTPTLERGTVEAAATILGLPQRTVQDLAARGEIPGAAKLGRRWTFDLHKLRQLLKQKERQTWDSAKRPVDVTGVPAVSTAGFKFVAETFDGRFIQVTRRLRARATKPRASG